MIHRLDAVALQQLLAADATPPPLLLDVREDWEYACCHIAGSLHIPMAAIPERIDSLDPGRATVLICHHGVRSYRVAVYLQGRGFENLFNLEGGIDAWAARVDPAMPRY
jgi:rhodanese-related sulfurtransferase